MPTTLTVRLAAVGLAAAATLLARSASAAPTVALDQGTTSVVLSSQLLGAATALGVAVDDVGPATLDGGVAFFPFTGGVLDVASAKGEIIHGGGLSLTAGGTVVTLTDFIIETAAAGGPRLTGNVTAGGSYVARVPLFNLALPDVPLPLAPNAQGKVTIRHVLVTLTPEAAAALNATFKVTAFTAGLPIGTAKVKVTRFNAL